MNLAEKARIAREEAEREKELAREKEVQQNQKAKEDAERLEREAKEREEREKQDSIDLENAKNILKNITKKKEGKVVVLGRYTQNKKDEPIEWVVLNNIGGEMTLISKYVLDCMNWATLERYNHSFDYKDSTVREFLNNEFYNRAFSGAEKKLIKLTSNDSVCSKEDGREIVTSTKDYVYLLSEMEAREIKPKILDAKPTKYAKSKLYNDKWWIRDTRIGRDSIHYGTVQQRYVTFLDPKFYDTDKKRKWYYGGNKIRIGFQCIYWYDIPKLEPQEPQECKRFGIRPVITIKTDI